MHAFSGMFSRVSHMCIPGRAISPFNLHATIISLSRTPALRFSERCVRARRAFENARLTPTDLD